MWFKRIFREGLIGPPVPIPQDQRISLNSDGSSRLELLKCESSRHLIHKPRPTAFRQILFTLVLALSLHAVHSFGSLSGINANSLGLVQVISPKASIKIDKVKGLDFKIGEMLPLFQQNEKYYIALTKDLDGQPVLAAFARKDFHNRATAWVTEEMTMVFARPASARSGKLYLRKGENIPVLEEARKTYTVEITRYTQQVTLEIRKKMKGIYYRSFEDLPAELQPAKPKIKKITLADLPPRKRSAPSVKQTPTKKPESPAAYIEESTQLLKSAGDKLASMFKSQTSTPPDGLSAAPPKEHQLVYYRPKEAYEGKDSNVVKEYSLNFVAALQKHSMATNVVLVILLIVGAGYVRHQRNGSSKTLNERESGPGETTVPSEIAAAQTSRPEPAQSSTFTGSLEVFKIRDLIQFLHNSSSTGVLNLEAEGVSDPGRIFLNLGEVKHASFNSMLGKEAFVAIFNIHRGTFRFQLSRQIKTQETIYTETSELIDETAKLIALQNEGKLIKFGEAG